MAGGITINALAIVHGDLQLQDYFETQVIGGPGAFVIAASGFDDYARAIRLKLLREIHAPPAGGVPGPRVAQRPLGKAPPPVLSGDGTSRGAAR